MIRDSWQMDWIHDSQHNTKSTSWGIMKRILPARKTQKYTKHKRWHWEADACCGSNYGISVQRLFTRAESFYLSFSKNNPRCPDNVFSRICLLRKHGILLFLQPALRARTRNTAQLFFSLERGISQKMIPKSSILKYIANVYTGKSRLMRSKYYNHLSIWNETTKG